jgi:hypothetical protein
LRLLRERYPRLPIPIVKQALRARGSISDQVVEQNGSVESGGVPRGGGGLPIQLVEALDVIGAELHVAFPDAAGAQGLEVLGIERQLVEIAQLRCLAKFLDLQHELTGPESFQRLELVDEARHGAAADADGTGGGHLARRGRRQRFRDRLPLAQRRQVRVGQLQRLSERGMLIVDVDGAQSDSGDAHGSQQHQPGCSARDTTPSHGDRHSFN